MARLLKKSLTGILLVALFSLGACRQEEKFFYDSGELKEVAIVKNDSCDLVFTYYKNGELESKGIYCNGMRTGVWLEYYDDGISKWSGMYRKGVRVYSDEHPTDCYIEFLDNSKNIEIGKELPLRVRVSGVHPDDITIASNNGIIKVYKDPSKFDFVIKPDTFGEMKLFVFQNWKIKNLPICTKTYVIMEPE